MFCPFGDAFDEDEGLDGIVAISSPGEAEEGNIETPMATCRAAVDSVHSNDPLDGQILEIVRFLLSVPTFHFPFLFIVLFFSVDSSILRGYKFQYARHCGACIYQR